MQKRIYKRKLYDKMLEWKAWNGKYSLLIEGARRVGKSTLAEEFAKKEYKSYIRIDFSSASSEIISLFDNVHDVNFLFLSLQTLSGIELHERNSVIVLDEIQLCPKARQAIKHLVADGRYDYIETGSLVSIRQNVKDILIPSEEHKLHLYPLDYEEFRWALGDNMTINIIRKSLAERKPLGEAVNRKLMRDLRLYMLVGGMPQAITEYLDTNNLASVDLVKRKILSLYEEDFRKTDSSGKLTLLFHSIPSQLSANVSRYKVTEAIGGARLSNMQEAIFDLEDSMTVNASYHACDPNIGMSLTKDLGRFKLYLADTGLFVTLAFMDRDVTDNFIYQKLLSDKLSANLGYVYENMVAQMLRAAGHNLFYYTWPMDNKKKNYEIDFLITRSDKICPVEVKSSGYKTHASLDAFIRKFSSRIAQSYLIYPKDMQRDEDVMCIPFYMTGLL